MTGKYYLNNSKDGTHRLIAKEIETNKVVLDVGCGQGFHTFCLSKDMNNAIGVDIFQEDIIIAKKRYPKVDFFVMNIEKLNFENNFFNKIYAMDVLEHVDNLDAVLNEIERVLKPGGQFIINIPYWKSEAWLLKIRPSYFGEIHHVRIFKDNQLEKILLGKGINLCKIKRTGFLTHIEHYYMFKRVNKVKTQLGIGNWRDNWKTKFVHISLLFFDTEILQTPLKYFPLWLITLPIGAIINFFGNKIFPKSVYYEFKKML